jgi:hypothetical protein
MSQLIAPAELLSLLLCFAPCFTQPSFRYCVSFIVAMIGGTERLTTTTVYRVSQRARHHTNYSRFLSRYPWLVGSTQVTGVRPPSEARSLSRSWRTVHCLPVSRHEKHPRVWMPDPGPGNHFSGGILQLCSVSPERLSILSFSMLRKQYGRWSPCPLCMITHSTHFPWYRQPPGQGQWSSPELLTALRNSSCNWLAFLPSPFLNSSIARISSSWLSIIAGHPLECS